MTPTITYNNRLELRFDGVPPSQIRGGLKAHGFHWDQRRQCWHLARPVTLRFVRGEPISQDGFAYALQFCQLHLGLTADAAAQLSHERDCATTQAAEQGMEEACGIR